MRLIFLFCLAACSPDAPPATGPTGSEAPETLRKEFEALVAKIQQSKDPAAARQALESYVLEEKHFSELFGPELAARAWPGYRDVVVAKLKAEAGEALVHEIVANGRTEVKVEGAGPAFPMSTTRGDQAIIDALKVKKPLYTVRFQKPGETLGLRLNGFVFHDGRWRALLKAYDHFAPPPPVPDLGAPDAAPVSDAAPPSEAAPTSEAAPVSGE